jgi:hypothetical protein
MENKPIKKKKVTRKLLARKDSREERHVCKMLNEAFGEGSYITEYTDVRYKNPINGHLFRCDFYIPKYDIFIELNKHVSHCKVRYDPTNPKHIKLLTRYQYKVDKGKTFYKRYIDTWTKEDVMKVEQARLNNLHYFDCYKVGDVRNALRTTIPEQIKNGIIKEKV